MGLHPLPGTDGLNLKNQFPAYLYKPHSKLQEILRSLKDMVYSYFHKEGRWDIPQN